MIDHVALSSFGRGGKLGIKFESRHRQALFARLFDVLPGIQVLNGRIITARAITRLAEVEAVLPRAGTTKEALNAYVGENPVAGFVFDALHGELIGRTEELLTRKPLRELPEYQDVSALVERLISQIEELPFTYVVSLPLSDAVAVAVSLVGGEMQLADNIWLRNESAVAAAGITLVKQQSQESSSKDFDLRNLQYLPGGPPPNAYLQIQVTGFIGSVLETEPLQQALMIGRQFFGLGLALGLFSFERYYSSPVISDIPVIVHLLSDGKWIEKHEHRVDERHSAVMRRIRLETEETGKISYALQLISTAFRSGESAGKILLGAHWFFECHCATDDLTRYVNATVTLETLLGEDEKEEKALGVKALLANRCAYSVGKTRRERNEILSEFAEIYRVRSRIVHSGKSRLSSKEYGLLNSLMSLNRRVIANEIRLIHAEANA